MTIRDKHPQRSAQFTREVDVSAELKVMHVFLNVQAQRREPWSETWRRCQQFPGARIASVGDNHNH